MVYSIIKEKLQKQDQKLLFKTLGYNNQKNFNKTLEKFLSFSTLHEWLESGNYDFVNRPNEFLTKLAAALEIDKQIIEETLEQERVYIKEQERFKNSYIFVNTNFKRTSESLFVLAFLEKNRYFSLYKNKDYLFKSTKEILKILSEKIKKHYEKNQEGLTVWGKIVSYQVHLENKVYIFDTSGVLLQNANAMPESKATLSLK